MYGHRPIPQKKIRIDSPTSVPPYYLGAYKRRASLRFFDCHIFREKKGSKVRRSRQGLEFAYLREIFAREEIDLLAFVAALCCQQKFSRMLLKKLILNRII